MLEPRKLMEEGKAHPWSTLHPAQHGAPALSAQTRLPCRTPLHIPHALVAPTSRRSPNTHCCLASVPLPFSLSTEPCPLSSSHSSVAFKTAA